MAQALRVRSRKLVLSPESCVHLGKERGGTDRTLLTFGFDGGWAMWPLLLVMCVLMGAWAAIPSAQAAGFALREQSAKGLANAFAGATAAAEDITFMYFNPAGLTRQSGSQVATVASVVVPRANLQSLAASTAAGVPITGGDGGDDIASDVFVPAAYALWDVHPDWRLGLGINAPYGLETDYDAGWVGRYHALRSRLRTVTATPTVAYRIHEKVSLGAGLQVQYIDAKLTNAIDFGTAGAAAGLPGARPTQQDGFVDLEASDIGFGFTLGVLVEPRPDTRFGLGYRSRVEHTFRSDADFKMDATGVGAALRAASGRFVDTQARVELTTPDTLSFGAYHAIGDRWAVMVEVAWTNWSRFRELRADFDNPAEPDSVTEEDWRDSWFFAAGATYRLSDNWTLRAGVAHDQSPIPDDRRTPRVPGNDRTWIALGGAYHPCDSLEISFGYTHIFLEDGVVDLRAADPGNLARGNLSGTSHAAIDIVAAQVSWRF